MMPMFVTSARRAAAARYQRRVLTSSECARNDVVADLLYH
jgi:hypothetical protein